jgi:hypothetical protein
MPEKTKSYKRVIFPPEVILEAYYKFIEKLPEKMKKSYSSYHRVNKREEGWEYEEKDEFFAEYRRGFVSARFKEQHNIPGIFNISVENNDEFIYTEVIISLPSRSEIESVFEIFEKNVKTYEVPIPPLNQRVTIYIGHGHNDDWKDLKDHLHEKHGFKVNAYEMGERSGQSIKEVLETMLDESSFALLVLTPEDEDIESKFHARENVIHELGLFQGRLGFERAIAIIAEGTEEFSNIHGINQLRYSKRNIKEIFGEVLATIKREFGEN